MAKIKVPDGRGFDILIWSRSATSPTWACPYTIVGRDYLRKFVPEAKLRVASKLDWIFPEDFLKSSSLKIGGISPGARVPMRLNPRLH